MFQHQGDNIFTGRDVHVIDAAVCVHGPYDFEQLRLERLILTLLILLTLQHCEL
jgi:hypothetical protein